MASERDVGDSLDGLVSPEILEAVTNQLLADLIVRKLGKGGIRISTRQRQRLAKWLSDGAAGEPPLPRHVKRLSKNLTISISARDERRLKGQVVGRTAAAVTEAMNTVAERMAGRALRDLRQEWFEAAHHDDPFLRGFERRLARTWKTGFELLEVQLYLAKSTAAEINDELRRRTTKAEMPLIEVLTSLHARACQIASEVLVLLRAGYPEGAISRWRSLHEVAIVLHFIDGHGVETAQRYLDHDAVESWKGAKEYAEHCGDLGFEPIDPAEFAEVKKACEAAVKKYGPEFNGSYGWAARDLGLKKAPKFEDVTKGAGFAHWRPLYRLASHPVHANPKSVKYRLGMIDGGPRCLPVGPTNYGLADPGQNTGLSLLQTTSVLIGHAPTLERLLVREVMRELAHRMANVFVKAQRRIERREMKFRAALTAPHGETPKR